MPSNCWRTAAIICFFLAASAAARAQSSDNLLLIVNAGSTTSTAIGEYYAAKRGVKDDQILRLTLPIADDISRADYLSQIETPIGRWLTTHHAQDRILYLVLTKDVPLRIIGTGGSYGTMASVDSELTLLYKKLAGESVGLAGPFANPYFVGDTGSPRLFSHKTESIYLVTRLDGYTREDVVALIDRSMAPSPEGRIILDGRLESRPSMGNTWLIRTAAALNKLPDWNSRTLLDTTAKVLTDQPDVLGFYSWGSNDNAVKQRHLQTHFVPGAIGAEFVSTDARTFQEPPSTWVLNDTNRPFKGSHQSLVADLIRDGITGVAGHVAEPYLSATIRPDVLFPSYVGGFNLAESFYLAMPSLSWQTVVIGDPLCAPFRSAALEVNALDPSIDPATQMPKFLADRRVAALTANGIALETARLFALSEVRLANEDDDGARAALEKATTVDGTFVDAHIALASLYERHEEWDAAIRSYRAILAKNPNHVPTLNSLAYVLAVHKQDPDALASAKRAYALTDGSASAADTLAWVHHLQGNDADALPLIKVAAKQLPTVADVRWHAAIIFAATGDPDSARTELDAAIKLDPKRDGPEAQELRARLRPNRE